MPRLSLAATNRPETAMLKSFGIICFISPALVWAGLLRDEETVTSNTHEELVQHLDGRCRLGCVGSQQDIVLVVQIITDRQKYAAKTRKER